MKREKADSKRRRCGAAALRVCCGWGQASEEQAQRSNRNRKKQDAAARRKQHLKHVLAADKDPARMEATKCGGWREDSDIKPRRKLQRNYLQ